MLFKPQDKDAFAHTINQAAEAHLGPLTYDTNTFALKSADSKTTIGLANVYAEYCAGLPWQRGRIITGFTQQFIGLTESLHVTLDQARTMLRPRIRTRNYYEKLHLQNEIDGVPQKDIPYRELGGGHLTLEVGLDRPGSIMTVSAKFLSEWGLKFEDALSIADENLLKLGTTRFRSPRPGLFVSDWNDVYDASRLHLGSIFNRLQVAGRPVAMVPNRNVLIVTGADDATGLTEMARLAEEALTQPRPMTGYAFRLDNGWVPFLPASEHPAYERLKRLERVTLGSDYGEQKVLLETLYKKNGSNIFVASIMVVDDRDWLATWGSGIDTLLPRTDLVAFLKNGSGPQPEIFGIAKWERVEAVLGDMMEPQGLYPERYRVRAFPSKEQLEQLELQS